MREPLPYVERFVCVAPELKVCVDTVEAVLDGIRKRAWDAVHAWVHEERFNGRHWIRSLNTLVRVRRICSEARPY